uniref:Uncharacterized protein n=1 Tax=Utricularia reniformis TaxID=192314 RepID=A0A1Y0AZ56_9LAMI|nr:hypothetical protein AEK19_MT0165 [Utricularia reniformis]ART30447.1 hypothetical protein AEK19_MT0165 [Utricularia reniformis]
MPWCLISASRIEQELELPFTIPTYFSNDRSSDRLESLCHSQSTK